MKTRNFIVLIVLATALQASLCGLEARAKELHPGINGLYHYEPTNYTFQEGFDGKLFVGDKQVYPLDCKCPKDMTMIHVILDQSGSMNEMGEEAVKMFNDFLESQRDGPDYAEMTVTLFSDMYVFDSAFNVNEIEPLKLGWTYKPYGRTALLDSFGATIDREIERIRKLPVDERPARQIFLVITDGKENASTKYDLSDISSKVGLYKDLFGWQFKFYGTGEAGIDAWDDAQKMGFQFDDVQVFTNDSAGFVQTSGSMTDFTINLRTGSVGTGTNIDIDDSQIFEFDD